MTHEERQELAKRLAGDDAVVLWATIGGRSQTCATLAECSVGEVVSMIALIAARASVFVHDAIKSLSGGDVAIQAMLQALVVMEAEKLRSSMSGKASTTFDSSTKPKES